MKNKSLFPGICVSVGCERLLERMQEPPVHCQIIRYLGEDRCVIRLKDTGAVIPIKVSSPLDVAKIALVTSLRPVEAKAVLGPYENEWFKDCSLHDVEWTETRHCFPCPTIHRKKMRVL